MNLAKLFNFKYLMQNIKKSKMAIILFLSVVPIFTSLLLIVSDSNSYVPSFLELGAPNVIFMYITPFILSFSLFGYVYKKKSIDFIGSMPISRKSIFITNTIGGIALIVLTQLITLLCTLIFGAITESLIFSKMVWDLFVYQTVAYIFVFTVANLAMSVSGNVVTQIVVTLLILFTVSASVLYVNLWNSMDIKLTDDDYRINTNYSISNDISYTAPSLLFNDGEYEYNTKSLVKMAALSIVYIVLGFYLFKNKKMEYAGESFENKIIHLVVKGLTLIPFVMILVALVDSDEWEGIMILMAIVAVYYLVYDLITNKKNKLRENIVALITSITVLFGVYAILVNVTEDLNFEIELDDIKSFNIEQVGGNEFAINTEIKDTALIEKMLYEANRRRYEDYYEYDSIRIILNIKNGDRKSLRIYNVPTDVIELVLQNVENIKLSNNAKLTIGYGNVELTKNEREKLAKVLKNAFENNDVVKIYKSNRNVSNSEALIIYDYKNNDIIKFKCPIEISEEVFNIVTKVYNREAIKSTNRHLNMGNYISFNIINAKVLKQYMPSDFNPDIGYYGEAPTEIIDFVLNSGEKECVLSKDYVCIYIDGERFYTNDLENFAKVLTKYYKDTEEYKYYKDKEIYETYENEKAEITTEVINLEPNSMSIAY